MNDTTRHEQATTDSGIGPAPHPWSQSFAPSSVGIAPVALITGGGSGIGRGIALALARRGVALALAGRQAETLERVAAEAEQIGVRAAALPVDLADLAARDTLLGRVAAALGLPAIVVHAAGLLAGGDLADLDPALIERAVAINLAAPLILTRAALPGIIARRGAIVLVASLAADVPFPSTTVYSATKAGIVALGEALRHEVGPRGVRVLVARPPATATAMTRGMGRAAGFPGYPLASPDTVGEAIVAALLVGRREWHGRAVDRAMALAHRLAPRLTRPLIRANRARLRRIFTAPDEVRTTNDGSEDRANGRAGN